MYPSEKESATYKGQNKILNKKNKRSQKSKLGKLVKEFDLEDDELELELGSFQKIRPAIKK